MVRIEGLHVLLKVTWRTRGCADLVGTSSLRNIRLRYCWVSHNAEQSVDR